jgi:RluA family pseudouridine synthase
MTPWGFELLDEQGPCLVVIKPGGVLTQAPPGIDSLELRVRRMLASRAGGQQPAYLTPVHRLDRPVSGLVVLATQRRAARRLAQQFQARLVQKTYWAWVEGEVARAADQWIDWMAKVPDQARAELVPREHAAGRQAVLVYQVLARRPSATLLEIGLQTGRMHQIRLQAASRGHPVLGDALYGSAVLFGPETEDPRQRWIALHARSIAFRHPDTRQPLHFTARLPGCWPASEADGGLEPA